MGNLFHIILIQPILNILVGVYQGLSWLHVPYSLGFSIIGLTIVIRLILYPLTATQLRTSKKMQELTPHLNRLKDRHKGNNQRLQSETMALYKQHGVNPAAGCLPMIIQLPVIWALYYVLQHVVTYRLSDINKELYFPSLHLQRIWNTYFFGLSLAATPQHLLSHVGPTVLLVPFLTGFFQFVQTKMMIYSAPAPTVSSDKKDSQAEFTAAFQQQSLYVFPVMIGFFSFTLPLGLSLYWITLTIFGIIQQYHVQGLGGLEELLARRLPSQIKQKKK